MLSFTDEQNKAINADGCGIIVSAAAGSGKTAVLVERLVRIISDEEHKVPSDRIVVVTFTKDAASQMKQRLSTALIKKLESDPDNQWLIRQQANIQTAKISTIHSFCFDLIRENINLIELAPNFRIIDESEEKIIVNKAISTVIENLCINRPDDKKILTEFFCTRGDKQLDDVIGLIYNFAISIPFWKEWMSDRISDFSADILPERYYSEYTRILSDKLKSLSDSARISKELAGRIAAADAEMLMQNESDMFDDAAKIVADETVSFEEKQKAFSGIVFNRIKFPKYEKDASENEEKEIIVKLRNTYKKNFKDLMTKCLFTQDDIDDDRRIHADVLSRMLNLISELDEEIYSCKLEKNAIGFSDAERIAVRLLSDNKDGVIVKSPLAARLSEYYMEIMIDEFQDANDMQNLIFRLLSKDESNVFVVGDVKQSIYRFRLANPALFVRKLENSVPYADGNELFSSVMLNKNFRSSRQVIDFVNFAFERLMSRKVGEIDYFDDEKLIQGAEFPDADRNTEILVVNTNSEDTVAEDEEQAESSEINEETINAEASVVALKIKDMLDKNICVSDEGKLRSCTPRDFCILVRNRAMGQLFLKALEHHGIRAATEELTGYLRSREMSVLINLLRVVDNPLLEIPLASVMMSPIFMLTADEIAEIRLVLPKENLYRAAVAALSDTEASYYPKLKRLCDILERLRFCAAGYSLEKLIRTIYDSTDYMSVIQINRDGEKKKANLRLLLEYARNYEVNQNGGLSGFMRYINAVSDNGGDFKKAGTSSYSDDVVSVKTIHKSKGLEFPFVFLCMTSVKFNTNDLNRQIQLDVDGGIGFSIRNKKELKCYNTLFRYIISERNKSYLISEELRLLYVALTRAKERLFITFENNDKYNVSLIKAAGNISCYGKITSRLAAGASSMRDWIAMILLVHPDGKFLRAQINMPHIMTAEDAPRLRIEFYDSRDTAADNKRIRAQAKASDVKLLSENLNSSYDYRMSAVPAKLTVSEIVGEGSEITLRRPKFALGGKLSGAEKGTATHLFMQYCDFLSAENDILAERDRLFEKGMLGKKESTAIEEEKLKVFFRSELFERMKKSSCIERERKFLVRISDLKLTGEFSEKYHDTDGMLQGVADCIFEEDGQLVLVDYKTDYVSTEKELTEPYASQLRLYKSALEMIYNKTVKELILYSFTLGRAIEIV